MPGGRSASSWARRSSSCPGTIRCGLAEYIINLDILSRGRAILGFGNGLAPHEYQGLRIDQNNARELYTEILELVIPALETGIIEGEGNLIRQLRRELRPRPLKSFEGRKFCGSLSGSSMRTAAKLGFGNMVLMLPQRGKETPPDMYDTCVEGSAHRRLGAAAAHARRQLLYPRECRLCAEQGEKYMANTMRAGITNYSLDKPGTFHRDQGL